MNKQCCMLVFLRKNTAVISKWMLNKKPVLDMKMRLMNDCLGPITVLN